LSRDLPGGGRVIAAIALLPLLLAPVQPVLPAEPPARRICSTSVAGDELLALLVSRSRVACVSTLVDDAETSNVAGRFPPAIARVPGRIEPVLAQRPDLVLVAPWNDPDFRELLARSSISSVALADVSSFEQIESETRRVAGLLGVEARGDAVIEQMQAKLAVLKAPERAPRILSFSHSIVAGSGTSVDALIRAAGGRNAAAEAGLSGHLKVTTERLLTLDPDVLLLGFPEDESLDRVIGAYPHLKYSRAVKEGMVIVIPPRLLTSVTPFLADGARFLNRELRRLAARNQ